MLRKITHGYVVQRYDPRRCRFISQEFIGGDSEFETEAGVSMDSDDFVDPDGREVYLSFEMVQPDESPSADDESVACPAPTITRSMMQRAIQIRPPVENLGVPETMVRELVQERAALLIEVAQRCPELLPPDLWLRVQRAVGM